MRGLGQGPSDSWRCAGDPGECEGQAPSLGATPRLTARAGRGRAGELKTDWPRLAETPVAPMLRSLPALTVNRYLSPTVQRTVRTIRQDEATIEVALDLGCIHPGKAEEDIHELELELKEGDAAAHRSRTAITTAVRSLMPPPGIVV
jgi:hypothetical protein